MIYDLSLALGWLPSDVRALTLEDVRGLSAAGERRSKRAKRRR